MHSSQLKVESRTSHSLRFSHISPCQRVLEGAHGRQDMITSVSDKHIRAFTMGLSIFTCLIMCRFDMCITTIVEICFHRKRSLRTVYQTFIARPSARSAHEGSGPCASLLDGGLLAPSQPALPLQISSPKIRRLSLSYIQTRHTKS